MIVSAIAGPVIAQQDPHAQMMQRGAMAMGSDQDKTTHRFLLYEDGGAIDISANDQNDTKNRDGIRAHLPTIAKMFGDGKFDIPMLVHNSHAVPGTHVLAEKRAAVKYICVETPNGGRVDIVTKEPAALAAVHDFLKYQITEHKTGDSLAVRKR